MIWNRLEHMKTVKVEKETLEREAKAAKKGQKRKSDEGCESDDDKFRSQRLRDKTKTLHYAMN